MDDLNEKEKKDPSVQAMFRQSRHNNLSISIISEDYYEMPNQTIRANGKIDHIFAPHTFRDLQNLFQDRASMDMTLKELKHLTWTCWDEKYQPLTTDTTKYKYAGRYRLGLNSLFIPDSSRF